MSEFSGTETSPTETSKEQSPVFETKEQTYAPHRHELETAEQPLLQDEVLQNEDQLPLSHRSEHVVDEQSILHQLRDARRRVSAKAEHLRQLKLVRTYRHSEETRDLDQVTEKWLRACQDSLRDYYQKVKETAVEDTTTMEDMTLGNFIEKLGIDKAFVKYDENNDDFLN